MLFFFFFSGYGLFGKVINGSITLAYWKRRIGKLFVPLFEVFLIYYVYNLYIGNTFGGLYLTDYLPGFWYIVVTFAFYMVLIIANFSFKNDTAKMLFIVAVFICYTIIGAFYRIPIYWINSSAGLFVGVLIARYRDGVKEKLGVVNHLLVIPLAVIISLAQIGRCFLAKQNGDIYISDLCCVQIIVMALLVIIVLSFKLRITNPILCIIGDCSYELFLIHGLFLDVFKKENELLYLIEVLGCSLVCAFLLRRVNRMLLK